MAKPRIEAHGLTPQAAVTVFKDTYIALGDAERHGENPGEVLRGMSDDGLLNVIAAASFIKAFAAPMLEQEAIKIAKERGIRPLALEIRQLP